MVKLSKNILSKFGYQIETKGSEIDLVCGMDVDADKARFKTTYKGKEYFFCSESCLSHFRMNPGKYAG